MYCFYIELTVQERQRPRMALARPYGIRRDWYPEPPLPMNSREMIRRIAVWHGCTFADVLGPSRTKVASTARRDAIVAVRLAFPALSLATLGRLFNRDHSTIVHHLNKAGVPLSPCRSVKKSTRGATNHESH